MPFYFSKLSVLVAEDAIPMRKLIVSVLESLEVGTILTAGHGEAAFKSFCDNNPDIVIVDWEMEPMDGIELTQKIRRSSNSPNRLAPIIFLTGYSAVKRVIKARDAGATEYLVKPFTGSELSKRIAYVINKPRDFVDSGVYFGPDRRRISKPGYTGPYRRDDDQDASKSKDSMFIDL